MWQPDVREHFHQSVSFFVQHYKNMILNFSLEDRIHKNYNKLFASMQTPLPHKKQLFLFQHQTVLENMWRAVV